MTSLNSTTKDLLYKKDFIGIKASINSYGNNLIYLGDESFNGRNCLRIRAGEDTEYLIDEETGFVLKYEASDGTLAEFNIEINNVTENDVKLPDLSKYDRVR